MNGKRQGEKETKRKYREVRKKWGGGEEKVCTVEELDADGDLFSPRAQTRWK